MRRQSGSPRGRAELPPDIVTHPPQDSESDTVSTTSSVAVTSPIVWTHTTLGDLIQGDRMISIDSKATVEKAFNTLSKYQLTCLPITHNGEVFDTFDYSNLNGYLLLVLGHIQLSKEEQKDPQLMESVTKARQGIPTSVEFAAKLGMKEPFVRMPLQTPITHAVQHFASGVHRIAAVDDKEHVVGILSQRRILRYIWKNLHHFPKFEAALDSTLSELQVGTYDGMVTVLGESPLISALEIMFESAVSSVAVVDREGNLLGNISVTNVSLLTRAWQAQLLRQSCKHFLTVVLEHRGLEDGKDVVPVFYVHRDTRLSRVIVKMVATKAHRLWIVEQATNPISSGKLVGVVSLTDLLNFVARQSGKLLDPETARRHRRTSSSSVRSNSRVRSQLFSANSPCTPDKR